MIDIERYIRKLRENIWIIVSIPVLAAIGSYFLLELSPKKYLSTAKLATGFTVNKNINLSDERFNLNDAWFKFDNLITILKSELVGSLVSYDLLSNDLNSNEPFRKMPAKATEILLKKEIDLNRIIDRLASKQQSMEVLSPYDPLDSLTQYILDRYGYASWQLKKQLNIQREQNSDFISITYTSENPHLSAFVVNSFARNIIDYDSLQSIQQSLKSVSFFENLVKEKKIVFEDRSKAVDNYKKVNSLYGPENKLNASTQIFSLEESRIAVNSRIQRLKLSIESINAEIIERKKLENNSASKGATARIIEIRERINSLNQKFIEEGGNDPKLVAKISELRLLLKTEMEKYPELFNSDENDAFKTAEELIKEKKDLELELKIENAELSELNNLIQSEYMGLSSTEIKLANLSKLELEAETASKEYLQAVERYNLEKNKALISHSGLQLIQKGLPNNYPTTLSKRKLLVLMTFVACLGICVALFIGIEYFDQSIKTLSEVESKTGIKAIGNIKNIKKQDFKLRKLIQNVSFSEMDDQFIESLRKIRYYIVQTKVKIILVTSTRVGAGKSFTTLALAKNLSLLNKKVLLIDTNFKNNELTREIINTSSSASKLIEEHSQSHYLRVVEDSDDNEPDFVQKTEDKNIDIIGNQQRLSSPLEIFAGKGFDQLLEHLSTKYHYIIMEGPALNDYSDTKELIDYADLVLPVLSTEHPFESEDRQSFDFLKKLNGKVLGVIMNKG